MLNNECKKYQELLVLIQLTINYIKGTFQHFGKHWLRARLVNTYQSHVCT